MNEETMEVSIRDVEGYDILVSDLINVLQTNRLEIEL